jgi:hypothetical protein
MERNEKRLVCKFIFFLAGTDLPLNEYFSTIWTTYIVQILIWTFGTFICMTEINPTEHLYGWGETALVNMPSRY